MPVIAPAAALSPADADAVRALAAAAAASDGVAPLSEQTLLNLAAGAGPVTHLLAREDGHPVGYAQVDTAASPASAELVVDPRWRRRGLGTALYRAAAAADPGLRVWAHGDLPGARALAAAQGLQAVRELHQLARPLGPADLDPAASALPEGFTARPFEPGRDEDAWLSANAAAFASHPEQGRMTRADLEDRMAQPWFDPAGLILVEARERPGQVAAFHWTKVHAGEVGVPRHGEVYVVGVHPAYQGRGLGRPVTALGLAHLAAQGLAEVRLYVDGDNSPALRTYTGLGFGSIMVDVMYAAVHLGLSG